MEKRFAIRTERTRDPLMGQNKKGGSARGSPWRHVNARKILFMRDARLRVQRDETGFSRQVELQNDEDDDDDDGGGSSIPVVVFVIRHHRQDRLSRYESTLMRYFMGNTNQPGLAQVGPLRSRSLAPGFAWNFK